MIQEPLRILISAYSCRPGEGSEPGVGWNIAVTMARSHSVSVLTSHTNRVSIEAAVARTPVENLNFHFDDLPAWLAARRNTRLGSHVYQYLWQIAAYVTARRLHRTHR